MPLTHEEIQRLDWKVILRPYWSFTWRLITLIWAIVTIPFIIAKIDGSNTVNVTNIILVAAVTGTFVTIDILRKVFSKSFEDFRVTTISNVNDEEIEPSPGMGFRLWWSYTWRVTLIGIILSLPLYILGLDPNGTTSDIFGAVSSIIIGFFVFKVLLQKRYKEFRVAVIPHENTTQPAE